MSDHIIQKRDLLEMLKGHDDTAEIVCEQPGYDSAAEMTIDRVSCHARRISIHVHEDNRTSELEDENKELTFAVQSADSLLERLSANFQAGGTPEEMAEELKAIAEDVEKYLDAR